MCVAMPPVAACSPWAAAPSPHPTPPWTCGGTAQFKNEK